MTIKRVAIIFDDETRPETTGVYCRRALESLVDVTHIRPAQRDKLRPGEFDLYLNIDDGLRYELPADLHPSAWWAIDTHLAFDWCLQKSTRFDFTFAAQRDGAEQLRLQGIDSAVWLPLACDPEIHARHEIPKTWDVCFIGHMFPGERSELWHRIAERFEKVCSGQLYFEDMARSYSAARTVFNRSIRNDINMRTFEAVACGSLLVTNDLADNGLPDLFVDGQHLATYRDADELLDKLGYYLRHDELRERIAAAGRDQALAKHTYAHRMQHILKVIEEAGATGRSGSVLSSPERQSVAKTTKQQCTDTSEQKSASYFEFARPELLEKVPLAARRVLEIGCGAGRLGQSIKERQPAEVVGIEFDPRAAAVARTRLDQVLVGDAEEIEPDAAQRKFDCVILGDVLEHLRDPAAMLRKIRSWLAPDGLLVASIPNVRNYSVVLSLIEGNWTYEPAGLLDSTHLHFFTRFEIERLLYRCGFSPPKIGFVAGSGYNEWVAEGSPTTFRVGPLQIGGATPADAAEFFAYQYLVEAVPTAQHDDGLTSIVIFKHDDRGSTEQCVKSICAHTDEPFEIFVVDNGQDDGRLAGLSTLPTANDTGNCQGVEFCSTTAAGIRATRGEQLLLLSHDVIVTPGWLRRLLDALRSDSQIGAVGPSVSGPESPQRIPHSYEALDELDRFAFEWGKANHGKREDVTDLLGCCLLVRRSLVDELDGLNACEHGDNVDGTALSQAVRQVGLKNVIARDAYIHDFGRKRASADAHETDQPRTSDSCASETSDFVSRVRNSSASPRSAEALETQRAFTLQRPETRPTIAVSLVNIDFLEMLRRMLTSLCSSDLNNFQWKLFYYDNGSAQPCVEYVRSLGVDVHIISATANQGIVGPRIELMEAILDDSWHYTLEVHTDMVFPKQWVQPLVAATAPDVGIVMPFAFSGRVPNADEMENLAAYFESDEVRTNAAHIFPWLLNNDIIRRVGYYNPIYAPMRCEDDDLVYRILRSRYRTVATRRSIVFHEGGGVRNRTGIGLCNGNDGLFDAIHGVSPRAFAKSLAPQPSLDRPGGQQWSGRTPDASLSGDTTQAVGGLAAQPS